MTQAILMHGAPDNDADLFHAVPAVIVDPFPYVEIGERRVASMWPGDADKLQALGIEVVADEALGKDELVRSVADEHQLFAELTLRLLRELGVTAATVPPRFPLLVADHLRAEGIELTPDGDVFQRRRRVKTAHQLEGIRRAQAAADEAMGIAAAMIAECRSSEDIRRAMQEACDARGSDLEDDVVVAHGGQGAVVHDSGSGVPEPGEPVIVDIWPRDRASRCWADMTRTFVAGGAAPPDELVRYWEITRESLEAVRAEIRAGASGRELFRRSCEPFEAAGIPTLLSKEPGTTLDEGYYHSLGHGVGLEIHERPNLGRMGDELVAGDVIAIEPGAYRQGFGGCRLEDLVIVTGEGCETVTAFPYDLRP